MDASRNPFSPGAGTPPPQLAGRQSIVEEAKVTMVRLAEGRGGRSHMLKGLRGTGKTVLLNAIKRVAEENDAIVSKLEAPEGQSLQELLYPQIHKVLRQLNANVKAKHLAQKAMGALRNFASVFKITVGEVKIEVAPEPGVSESGLLELDLIDLFSAVGKAVRAAGTTWALLIDEMQYLTEKELSALIVALHQANQDALPIYLCGAGLPQIAKLSGDAKSYAERLFHWHQIDALDPVSAGIAIRLPVQNQGALITEDAIAKIIEVTKGYPYFLQEWGHHSWNMAEGKTIELAHVQKATSVALENLDQGFFRVRLDRLTGSEKKYVFAMATLGAGPYRTKEIADALGKTSKNLTKTRSEVIKKGMIYSQNPGLLEFTVPEFEEFLMRVNSI